jgi:hypothetical protein
MKTLFFLHLPKCAGMSLTDSLRANLAPDQVYQSTSMIQNYWRDQAEFMDINHPDRLRALSGHWLHEMMLPRLNHNLIFATSIRNPIDRTRSQFRFDVALRTTSWPRQTTEEFLRNNTNVMCNFLTRAFPSIAAQHDNPLEASKAIISGMDCVFDVPDASYFQRELLKAIGVAHPEISLSNTSGEVTAELEASDDEVAEALADDLALYEWFSAARSRALQIQTPKQTLLQRNFGVTESDTPPRPSNNPVACAAMRAELATLSDRPVETDKLADFLADKYAVELFHGVKERKKLWRNIDGKSRFYMSLQNRLREIEKNNS